MIQIKASHRLLAETLQNYVQRLSEQGIKRLGVGAFSYVFQHPTMSNVVVKLLHEEDVGYVRYVKFCRTNGKDNPYCPKILQVSKANKIFTGNFDPSLTLVFIEKLRPMLDTEYKVFAKYCATVMSKPKLYTNDGASLLGWDETWNNLGKQTNDIPLAQVAAFMYRQYARKRSKPWSIDIHNKNVMKRGPQVVITDPFSS